MGMQENLAKLTGKGTAGDMTPAQMGNWYLEQAMAFERSKTKTAQDSKILAWKCFAAAMAMSALTVVTSAVVVFKNKPNPPGVLQVHDNGDVTVLKTLADAKIKYGQATDIAYLRKYISYRESYDWEMIQSFFDATMLLSNPREGSIYAAFNNENNKMAPVNVLTDKVRVIATAGTISFVGKTALVSFSKKTIPLNGHSPTTDYFVATIAYTYEDHPMDDSDRGINVAGFKVTSYQVARDLTRSAVVAAGDGKADGSGK